MIQKPNNFYSMQQLLAKAQTGGFAVGAFSPRYLPMIRAVFRAAEKTQSPVLLQIAQVETQWFNHSNADFAAAFWEQFDEVKPSVPVGLHLDHTQNFDLIVEAIEAGFNSVMIDASALPLEKNINETKKVVAYAHEHGVSVEAELGRIGEGDFGESDVDDQLFTDPAEAAYFVAQTGVDALAVSVGTAHGVYNVRQPHVDLERIQAIRSKTNIPLVLHGGSGTPADMIRKAIQLPGGGISKVNIATDLELGLLTALGLKERTTDTAVSRLPEKEFAIACDAVQAVVEDKIQHFLFSAGHAADYY